MDSQLALATWALVGVTALLALATIVLVSAQTRALKFTFRTDALSRSTAQWNSPSMRAGRRQISRWLQTVDRKSHEVIGDRRISEIADFFEYVGALLRKGRLDFDLVWQIFSDPAVGWWEAVASGHADYYRKQDKDPETYSQYRELVRRLKIEDSRRVPGFPGWSESDIQSFLKSESELLRDEPLRIVTVDKAEAGG